jgi:hypothetical protein
MAVDCYPWGVYLAAVAATVWLIQPWGQFPLNDDWVYAKNVLSSLSEGTFTIRFSQYAWAIPQMFLGLWLAPDAHHPFATLRSIGIVSTILAAPLTAWIAARAVPLQHRFLFWVGTVSTLFFAPYFQPGFSFMTDLPAFLLTLLSLYTLALYLERRTLFFLSLAIAANAVAVSQRQLALLIPLSMGLYACRNFSFHSWSKALKSLLLETYPLLLFVVPMLVIQVWWSRVSPLGFPTVNFSPNPGVLVRFFRHLTFLGWTALPFFAFSTVVLSAGEHKVFRRAVGVFAVGGALHLLNSYLRGQPYLMPFFNNVLTDAGFLPMMLGMNADGVIFPIWFRIGLTFLGMAGAIRILHGFSLIWTDSQKSALAQVLLASSLLYTVFICFRVDNFDRYAIPILPLSLLCLMRSCDVGLISKKRKTVAVLLAAPYILFTIALTYDYFRWNEARWAAIAKAETLGAAPEKINAGHEYSEWSETKTNWGTVSGFDYIVTFSELPGLTTVAQFPYRSVWKRSGTSIYLQSTGAAAALKR